MLPYALQLELFFSAVLVWNERPFAGEWGRHLLPWVSLQAAGGGSALDGQFLPIHKHNTHQPSFFSFLPPPHPSHPYQQHLILITSSHSPRSHIQPYFFFLSPLVVPTGPVPYPPPNALLLILGPYPPPHQPVLISITAALTHRFLPSNLRLTVDTFILFLPLHYVGNRARDLSSSRTPPRVPAPHGSTEADVRKLFFLTPYLQAGGTACSASMNCATDCKNPQQTQRHSWHLGWKTAGCNKPTAGLHGLMRWGYLLRQRHRPAKAWED